MSDIFTFTPGDAPLLISVPHAGTNLSPGLAERLTPQAAGLFDTDWFVDRLYDFAAELGISLIKANYSRYVIDLNRPIDGAPLYPGKTESSLTPTTTFDGFPIYKNGAAPSGDEIHARISTYWQPYHHKLKSELDRLCQRHGRVLLWDAHSIKARLPRFFEGRLPDLNFGSADGRSCAPEITANLLKLAQKEGAYSHVLNGRFKGGYITRHYGDPQSNIHAVQLEIAQDIYMQEDPPEFDAEKTRLLQKLLRTLLASCLNFT